MLSTKVSQLLENRNANAFILGATIVAHPKTLLNYLTRNISKNLVSLQ